MQWIEDSINKELLKLYKYEDFKEVNKIYDGYCLEVYSAVYKSYRVAIKSLLSDNNECINEIVREVSMIFCRIYENKFKNFFSAFI